jgi:hypothetical protein
LSRDHPFPLFRGSPRAVSRASAKKDGRTMSDDDLVSPNDNDPELAEYVEAIGAVGKRAVFEIGKILIAAKARARHGRWLPWLEREFGWTDKTAQRMMNVAGKSDKLSNLAVPISALYLLAAQSTPAEVIETIAERSEQGERLSLAEVKQMIAKAEADDAPDEDEEDDGLATRMPLSPSDAEHAYRSRYGDVRQVPYCRGEIEEQPVRQVRFEVTYSGGETVHVPYYVPHEQPAPRTIEDFQRDCNRGRAEALARHLDGVERNLDEHDTRATIEAMSDEERDQARRVVDKLKAALDEDEMSEAPDQRN